MGSGTATKLLVINSRSQMAFSLSYGRPKLQVMAQQNL